MISVTEIAKLLEEGLNEALGNPEICFHIWANVGEYRTALRSGNTAPYTIHGNLRVATSANDANILVMGMNGLSLDFLLPIEPPRTNSKQTEEQLQTVQNEQYPFPALAISAIDTYFAKAQTVSLGKNGEYSVSFAAGVATPGTVDMFAEIGRAIPVSVYINLYFIEGGTMSKDVKLYFDGMPVPFQSLTPGRSAAIDRDIDVKDLISKGTASSSAFSLHIRFPSNHDAISKAAVEFLMKGKPNVAHFVELEWDDLRKAIYLMTFEGANTSAEGIAIAGAQVDLIEILDNCEIVGVPDTFQIGRFVCEDPFASSLSLALPAGCRAYFAGRAFVADGAKTVSVEPSDFEYDEETEKYYVYLITDRAVPVTGVGFETVKEARSG